MLSFEYWNQSGLVSRFLLHDETLAVVRTRINKANIDDFVQLLIERGDIDDFVAVLQYPIDQDGAFRSFMLQNGADLAQIRFYASCYGIDPKLFLDGFVIGLAESFAPIVVDLWKLVELAGRAQRELFGSAVMTLMDPKAGIANFSQQKFAMVGQFIDALMSQLSPPAGWPEGDPAEVARLEQGVRQAPRGPRPLGCRPPVRDDRRQPLAAPHRDRRALSSC